MSKTKLLSSSSLVRADAEEDEKEKREDRKDAQLNTEIMDAVGKCMDAVERMADSFNKRFDRMDEENARRDSRMDSMEREDKRKDEDEKEEKKEDRKDASDEKEEKEERREDKRKDNSEDVGEEKERQDRARRDSAKKDEDEKEREDKKDEDKEERHADSVDVGEVLKKMGAMQADMDRMRRLIPKQSSDADAASLARQQAIADDVYVELGLRAPRPQLNEDLPAYRRRVAIDLQKHSPRLREADLWSVNDSAAFDILEGQIFADALEAARKPVDQGQLHLRGVTKSQGGHEFTTYYGDSASWMLPMSLPATRGYGRVPEMMKAMQAR